MNRAKISLIQKSVSFASQSIEMDSLFYTWAFPNLDSMVFASQGNAAGSKKPNQEQDDKKKAKMDNSEKEGSDNITNKASKQKDDAYITHPDTNLTGELGNLDVGQTDLGASGSGAEDL